MNEILSFQTKRVNHFSKIHSLTVKTTSVEYDLWVTTNQHPIQTPLRHQIVRKPHTTTIMTLPTTIPFTITTITSSQTSTALMLVSLQIFISKKLYSKKINDLIKTFITLNYSIRSVTKWIKNWIKILITFNYSLTYVQRRNWNIEIYSQLPYITKEDSSYSKLLP